MKLLLAHIFTELGGTAMSREKNLIEISFVENFRTIHSRGAFMRFYNVAPFVTAIIINMNK
jgi:hypothetical protein